MIDWNLGDPAAWAVVAEVVILCLGGHVFFRRRGNTFAEACAFGTVTSLMTLSLSLQLSFMVRRPAISFVCEAFLLVIISGYIIRHRGELYHGAAAVRSLCSRAPLTSLIVGLLLIYLALLALIIPMWGLLCIILLKFI